MARALGNQFFLKGFQQDQPSPLAGLWGWGTCAWVCREVCALVHAWARPDAAARARLCSLIPRCCSSDASDQRGLRGLLHIRTISKS